MKKRLLEHQILNALNKCRILILIGSHRSGKSAILKSIAKQLEPNKTLFVSQPRQLEQLIAGDDLDLYQISEVYDYLIIDLPGKLDEDEINRIIHEFRNKIILTSSLQIDLLRLETEDYQVFIIHPFSVKELYNNARQAIEAVRKHLIYGSYPEVLEAQTKEQKIQALNKILDSNLNNSVTQTLRLDVPKLMNLLKLLAKNIGKNISFSTMTNKLRMDKHELRRYLDFLHQRFIIFSMHSFSRNLPKEMSKAQKFYFWDLGVRNLLVNDFAEADSRKDIDQMWENFCISERLKRNHWVDYRAKNYFWKTYDQKEIPYLEESHGFLFAYSFYWKRPHTSYPRQFLNAYANSVFSVINLEKFWDFIG